MIDLESHAAGAILPVRAHAGARRNQINAVRAGSLHVSVTEAPEKGKANRAIIALLATSLGLRKAQIELLSGDTSRAKRFLIRDIAPAELKRRVARRLENRPPQ
jgi:uncharacterized protein YggU (UPF0235/DUF167 family)